MNALENKNQKRFHHISSTQSLGHHYHNIKDEPTAQKSKNPVNRCPTRYFIVQKDMWIGKPL